jgi:hypothetical protein
MKFYYENDDYKNIPNGVGDTCIVSDIDFYLGFNNATLSLDIDDTILNLESLKSKMSDILKTISSVNENLTDYKENGRRYLY